MLLRGRTARPPKRPAEPDARETRSRRHTPSGDGDARRTCVGSTVMTSTLPPVSDWEFEQYVQAEVDGIATPQQLAVLEADLVGWRAALASLRREAEEHLERA